MKRFPETYPYSEISEFSPNLPELSARATDMHDALQLSYADPERPASLTEQRAVFLGIVKTAMRDRSQTVDPELPSPSPRS